MSRILIVGFCAVPGPDRAGVQLRHVLRALAPHHSVDVLVARHGDQPYVERHGTARLLRVPLHESDLKKQVEAFRRALRRQLDGAEYDVVHFRDGWSGIPVLEQRERLRFAAVFDVARAPMADSRVYNLDVAAELGRDEEACLIAADAVLAPHEPARRYLAARGRHGRVHLVPAGVDVDQFDYDEPPPAGPARVLCVGTLAPGRGVRILLRAMVEVIARVDARLILAGPSTPTFDRTLRSAIAELRLTEHVDLLGSIEHDRVPALIATATVCVAPAAMELSPRPTALYPTKILEYMACRRPVVAPRRGTVNLVMKDNVHGLLFTPGDPNDLAARLVRVIEDPQLQLALATRGYEQVRASFTASATRRSLRAAYRALASEPAWAGRLVRTPTGDAVPAMAPEMVTTELSDRDLLASGAVPQGGVPAYAEDGEPTQAIETTADDETSVDVSPARTWRVTTTPTSWAERSKVVLGSGDDWIIEDTHSRAAAPQAYPRLGEDDEDGTPVDVRVRSSGQTPPVEARFVAGELDSPTPGPAQQRLAEPLDDDTRFTAVSVLLGSPDSEQDTPTPRPRKPPRDR
ncbi:MAG TPA: glycosyltransferase family 4 protein [Kofleriaceae bacterium]|nr:glycosyltransferase family 4 protein [Kofleriaceae bacterium]